MADVESTGVTRLHNSKHPYRWPHGVGQRYLKNVLHFNMNFGNGGLVLYPNLVAEFTRTCFEVMNIIIKAWRVKIVSIILMSCKALRERKSPCWNTNDKLSNSIVSFLSSPKLKRAKV